MIHGKYHGNTGDLLGNVDVGTQEFGNGKPCEQRTDITDRRVMTSCRGCTSESHKGITQTNCTEQDDVTPKNGNNKQRFGVLQSNSGAYGVPETC